MDRINKAAKSRLLYLIVFSMIVTVLFPINSCFASDANPAAENTDRVIILSTNQAGRSDCILVQSQGLAGLIDTSNRLSSTITDYDGKIYDLPKSS